MKKEKLIAEYQRKIEDCDDLLNRLAEEIRIISQECNDSEIVRRSYADAKIRQSAKRQTYVQFIKDLEDLIQE